MSEDLRLQVIESLLRYKSAENEELQSKNAKLRELVRHMRSCMVNKDCDTCVYRADACDFEYYMHELGIEVGDSGDGHSE